MAGGGLLDQLAASLARDLLAADEPLPFGGDDPVTLPQEIVDAITAVIDDEDIIPEDRFDELSTDTQVALREQVLAQRLATIELDFRVISASTSGRTRISRWCTSGCSWNGSRSSSPISR